MCFQKLSIEVNLLSGEKQDRQKVIQVPPEHSPVQSETPVPAKLPHKWSRLLLRSPDAFN